MTIVPGILRLDLDREAYERAGLQGQPCRGGGRKHIKARYCTLKPPDFFRSSRRLITGAAIEVNLRQPSMLRGKKGFGRVVWAAKNVLNKSLTWLFYDLRTAGGDDAGMSVICRSATSPLICGELAQFRRCQSTTPP